MHRTHILRPDLGIGLSVVDVSSSPTPVELRAVRLSTLKERLSTASELDVLNTLATTQELVETIDANQVHCALISYRQERGGDDAYGHLTLDSAALRGAMVAAQRLGAVALWIDVWCYRFDGDYDHDDFCQTLHSVLGAVSSVVWLPGTKLGSNGEYPHRLWCTFEAACVQQRRLRVAVGGAGTTRFQRHVRRFGSFAPALYGDGILDDLVRLNLWACVELLGFLCNTLTRLSVLTTFSEAWNFRSNMLGIILVGMIWCAGRASLSREVRLAKNARVVLRIMQAATNSDEAAATKPAPHAALLRELPWLAAYDRRDALVVQELLARARPDLRPCAHEVMALAVSAHTAARLRPSPGDESASRLPLHAWLLERKITISAAGLSSGKSQLPSDGSTPRVHAQQEELLPFAELHRFGWTVAAGSNTALLTPLGTLEVVPPRGERWALTPSAPQRRAQLGVAIGVLLLTLALQNYVDWMVALVFVRDGAWPAFNTEQYDLAKGVAIAPKMLVTFILLAIVLWIWRVDLGTVSTARVPLPFAVFHGVCANCLFGAACLVGGGVRVLDDALDQVPSMRAAQSRGDMWGARLALAHTVEYSLMTLGLAYEFLLVVVLVATTCSQRGGRSAVDDVLVLPRPERAQP